MANRLANETSPYLLQHANNPVDWWPWSPDALVRAKLLDQPIFLSIGYAACHWCHVMERESFENEATARYLNERFIPIKVDREERPDLDQIYMGAVQAMTGGGGWPMSVFLTPDGKPFYGGTYFPDEPRHGLPSFRQVLQGVDHAWREQRGEIEQAGVRLVDTLARQRALPGGGEVSHGLLDAAVASLERQFDQRDGGWGGAPKFPAAATIEFLLRRHLATGDESALAMARVTLDRMADGGIRDQLGGGFHRYATDAIWLVPHFEQMLYDNAQVARVYVHAWQATGDNRYADVAGGILDYNLRELTTSDGAFAASQDADTDGVEGATFTWTAAEIREVLGDAAPAFTAAYDVTDDGNWEGRTILSRVQPPSDPAAEDDLRASRARLFERRRTRPQPARDDKALAAWNGLAIAALAEGSALQDGSRYREAAIRAAEAILAGLRTRDGRLGRSWKDGRSSGRGTLEDYTHLADGLLALYEATFDERWFVAARELIDTVIARFADPVGGFFDTADDHERLIARPKEVQDNAVPSGNSMAALALLRLAAWTGEGSYRSLAERSLGLVGGVVGQYPTAFGNWLVAMDLSLADAVEIAIVGDPGDAATIALLGPVRSGFRPRQVVAATADPGASAIPLLHDRFALNGRPTAFVCRNFACRQPVTESEALAALLLETASPSPQETPVGSPTSRR
jgi:uncharacterized protein YyaL (SSP411 family)